MDKNILVRMGDGQRLWMAAREIKTDIAAGTEDAADRAHISELSLEE